MNQVGKTKLIRQIVWKYMTYMFSAYIGETQLLRITVILGMWLGT